MKIGKKLHLFQLWFNDISFSSEKHTKYISKAKYKAQVCFFCFFVYSSTVHKAKERMKSFVAVGDKIACNFQKAYAQVLLTLDGKLMKSNVLPLVA